MAKYIKRTLEDSDKETQKEYEKRRKLTLWLQKKYPEVWKAYETEILNTVIFGDA